MPPPISAVPPPLPPSPPTVIQNNAASDADFWSGNVLGWPSGPEPQSKPVEPPPPPVSNPPPSFGDRAFALDPIPESEPQPMGAPEPAYEKPALEGGPFSLDTPFMNLNGLDGNVPAPLPPLDPPPEVIKKDIPMPMWDVDEVVKSAPLPPPDQPLGTLPPVELPIVPPMPGIPSDQAIPIPMTVTDREQSPVKPRNDAELDLNGTELKPAGFIQIACMFPDGLEKDGQQFVGKLRELADKSKARLKLNTVFVNAWGADNINTVAWIKSATLSGADILFILAFKKEMDLFKNIQSDPTGKGIKIRVVNVEQLGLRALYADILIELERGR
jgi:hypothetical protein